ncbi:MAG: hypothetical protein ACK4FJ_01815 [Ferrovibrio sp.]|uniref:hypothetical protein n=1 Tax=Ferrovibrio sp. TaxID=1917215 RepID=UPI00391ADB02
MANPVHNVAFGRRMLLASTASLALLLSGCSYVSDELWPSLTGEDPAGGPAPVMTQQIPPSAAEANPNPVLGQSGPAPAQSAPLQPTLGTTNFVVPGVTPGQATGTFVGQKVQQMRGELAQLQQQVTQRNQQLQAVRASATQNSQRYHGLVAAVSTRLQMGTTPGNPILVSQWTQAQTDLDRMAADVGNMSNLANQVAADSAMSTYLLQSIKSTYSISGAIDEDHRQLAVLEDETAKTVVLIDRLLGELSQDVARQTNYIGAERTNLTTLSAAIKQGELLGPGLGNRANFYAGAQQFAAIDQSAAPVSTAGRTPLVVIRFDRADVPYQQALYNAVSQAIARKPNAVFDVVAVAAGGTQAQTASNQNQARRNADRVIRSLADMGLPASRVNVSAGSNTQAATNEVHVFVR